MLRASLLVALASVAPAQDHLERVERLPVRFNGRGTTLARYAEGLVADLSAGHAVVAPDGRPLDPTTWLLDLLVRRGEAREVAILHLPAELARAVGLEVPEGADDLLVSHEDVRPIADRVYALLRDDEPLTWEASTFVGRFETQLALSRAHPRPRRRNERSFRAYAGSPEPLRRTALPRLLPPLAGTGAWDVFLDRMWVACTDEEPPADPSLEAYVRLLEGHRKRREEEVLAALDELEAAYAALDPAPRRALAFEVPPGWNEIGVPPAVEVGWFSDIRSCSLRTSSFRTDAGLSAGLVHAVGPGRSDGEFWQAMRLDLQLAPGRPDDALHTRTLEVAGERRPVFDAVPWSGTDAEVRQVAALVRRGPHTFVFTATAPRATMDDEIENVEAFLASLRPGTPESIEAWTGRTPAEETCDNPDPARLAVFAFPLEGRTALVLLFLPREATETPGEAVRKFLLEYEAMLADEAPRPRIPEDYFLETHDYAPMSAEERADLVVFTALRWTTAAESADSLRTRVERVPLLGTESVVLEIEPPS